ncbi:hypothetical protein RCL1_008043 [Eukaryota sp. TZLM3-RCL]
MGEQEDYQAFSGFENYMNKTAIIYDDTHIWAQAKDKLASELWSSNGTVSPLKKVAVQILGQVASSSSAERDRSAFGYIVNKRRNRLSVDLIKKLVFVFCNLNLKARASVAKQDFSSWLIDDEVEREDESGGNERNVDTNMKWSCLIHVFIQIWNFIR